MSQGSLDAAARTDIGAEVAKFEEVYMDREQKGPLDARIGALRTLYTEQEWVSVAGACVHALMTGAKIERSTVGPLRAKTLAGYFSHYAATKAFQFKIATIVHLTFLGKEDPSTIVDEFYERAVTHWELTNDGVVEPTILKEESPQAEHESGNL